MQNEIPDDLALDYRCCGEPYVVPETLEWAIRRDKNMQRFARKLIERIATLEAHLATAQAEVQRMRDALEHPSGVTHCCYCGTYNVDDPKGYAGERNCHACGNGGEGEGDLPDMASNSWKHRRAALAPIPASAAQPVTHAYTSTACYHGQHDRCRRECKFCAAQCQCSCHAAQPEEDGAEGTPLEASKESEA